MKTQKGEAYFPGLKMAKKMDALPENEVLEKRTASAKLYSLGKNLFQAVVYGQPIHYQDKESGAWEEIDNELVEADALDGAILRNRANGYLKVLLREEKEPWTVTVENEDGILFLGRLKKKEKGESCERIRSAKPEKETRAKLRGEMPCAERIAWQSKSSARYQGVFPDVDVHYAIEGATLKDNIIFHTRSAVRQLSFLFHAPGLTLHRGADDTIRALDKEGGEQFVLPAPFVMDGVQENGSVELSLEPVESDIWRMTYAPDME